MQFPQAHFKRSTSLLFDNTENLYVCTSAATRQGLSNKKKQSV